MIWGRVWCRKEAFDAAGHVRSFGTDAWDIRESFKKRRNDCVSLGLGPEVTKTFQYKSELEYQQQHNETILVARRIRQCQESGDRWSLTKARVGRYHWNRRISPVRLQILWLDEHNGEPLAMMASSSSRGLSDHCGRPQKTWIIAFLAIWNSSKLDPSRTAIISSNRRKHLSISSS